MLHIFKSDYTNWDTVTKRSTHIATILALCNVTQLILPFHFNGSVGCVTVTMLNSKVNSASYDFAMFNKFKAEWSRIIKVITNSS